MNTIAPERAEQLKAEAIAARRASRPAWRNAHADRQAREREARRVAKQYRQTAKPDGKRCSACGQTLPLDSFSPAHRDRPTARCKPCVAAATRARYHGDLAKARSRTRNRPAATPEQRREREQVADQRQRKAEERQRAKAERERGRRRKIAERIAQLTALLTGTDGTRRIATQEGWDMASSELRSLWLQSGDKTCVACQRTVPPTAMLPPGPANFYPGKCRPCAAQECYANTLRVTGRPPEGPRLIPMLDGTAITVAELARRHRARERGYPVRSLRSG